MLWSLLVLTLAGGASDWVGAVKTVTPQIQRIESLPDGEDNPAICSGIVLDKDRGYVLTAAHCVPPGDGSGYAVTVNGRHAVMVLINRRLDLAVLKTRVKSDTAIVLAPETPAQGTEIAVLGFMLGSKEFRTQFGHVAAKRSEEGAVVIDGVTLPGDSGGAVVDGAGRLIGMTNKYYSGTAVGLAVPVEDLRDFADDYLPKK